MKSQNPEYEEQWLSKHLTYNLRKIDLHFGTKPSYCLFFTDKSTNNNNNQYLKRESARQGLFWVCL